MELNEQYLVNKYGEDRLKELIEVDLSSNGIKCIDLNAFKELTKLETLKLDNNEIAKIQFLSFINQKSSLRILNLNNNKLKEIPFGICFLKNLIELYLNENMIKEIDSRTFIGFNSLIILDLGNNKIEEISEKLCDSMVRLKILKLNNNKIKKIHRDCLQPLKSIEVIQLYGNDLTNVRSFFLESTELSNSFYDLDSLREYGFISDWKNFLEQFPSSKIQLPIRVGFIISNKSRFNYNDSIQNSNALFNSIKKWDEFELMQQFIRPVQNNQEREREIMERERREREERERERREREIRERERREIEERQRQLREAQENEQRNQRLDREKKPTINSLNNQETSQLSNNKNRFERYKMETMLGSGNYGVVYKVRDNQNNNQYKVMKMIKNVLDESAKMELEKMNTIHHENIVKYYDHFIHSGYIQNICIITEYCQNCNLEKKISEIKRQERGKFSENEISDWTLQAANGVRYLHSISIVHGDIKPSNLLLSETNEVKLADTGIAKCIRESGRFDTSKSSLPYMSPELVDENYHYYTSSDIWSLGCVLYELIHLRLAFPLDRIRKTDIPSFTGSDPFTRFLEKMIVIDPKVRVTSKELYEQFIITFGN